MNFKCFENKKVLMFGPNFFGYAQAIAGEITALGGEVDFYDERPNNSAFCKVMLRKNVSLYHPVVRKYYKEIIEQNKDKDYDFVFVIKSEGINKEIFSDLKNAFKNAKFVLYLWDGIDNIPGGKEKIKMYDRVLTFDPKDAKEYSLIHRPLFYKKEYALSYEEREDYDYEVAFIGTAHTIRPFVMNRLAKQCEEMGKKCFSYLFLPHIIVFIYNKLLNKAYKGIKKKDIHFTSISADKINEIYSKSKCILDVEHAAQRGLTMRTIEMIGVGRKLITTNKGITEYDFYNKNNICVIDRQNPQVPNEFWTSRYEQVPKEILERYSITSFVRDIFDIKE